MRINQRSQQTLLLCRNQRTGINRRGFRLRRECFLSRKFFLIRIHEHSFFRRIRRCFDFCNRILDRLFVIRRISFLNSRLRLCKVRHREIRNFRCFRQHSIRNLRIGDLCREIIGIVLLLRNPDRDLLSFIRIICRGIRILHLMCKGRKRFFHGIRSGKYIHDQLCMLRSLIADIRQNAAEILLQKISRCVIRHIRPQNDLHLRSRIKLLQCIVEAAVLLLQKRSISGEIQIDLVRLFLPADLKQRSLLSADDCIGHGVPFLRIRIIDTDRGKQNFHQKAHLISVNFYAYIIMHFLSVVKTDKKIFIS